MHHPPSDPQTHEDREFEEDPVMPSEHTTIRRRAHRAERGILVAVLLLAAIVALIVLL